MRQGIGFAILAVGVGCGVCWADESAEKAAAAAKEPAPLLHDKRIHGQTVKIEVGRRPEVRVSGG